MTQAAKFIESLPLQTRIASANTIMRAFEILTNKGGKISEVGKFMWLVRRESTLWSQQYQASTRDIGIALWDFTDKIGNDMFGVNDKKAYMLALREEIQNI